MNKFMVVFSVVCLVFAASLLIAEEGRGPIKVHAKIANMDAAGKQITKDSYLQLIRVTPDWSFKVSSDSNGKITYISDLAKTKINPAGEFELVANVLEPGKYAIAAQLVQQGLVINGAGTAHDAANPRSPLLLKKGKNEVAVFTVPNDLKGELKVDLGDLVISIR
jgi:hypothetical protein